MLPEPVKPLEEWHLNHGAHEFELGNSSLFQLTCRNASSGYAMYLGDARDVKEFRTKAEAEASVDAMTLKGSRASWLQPRRKPPKCSRTQRRLCWRRSFSTSTPRGLSANGPVSSAP